MSILQLIVIAVVQGITEFLPISSSAHLVVVPRLAGWPDQGLALDVAVHVGTLGAVLVYFRRDVGAVLAGVFAVATGRPGNEGGRLAGLIALATVPVVALGGAMHLYGFDESLRRVDVIGGTLIGFGILLFVADRIGMTVRRLEHMGAGGAVFIGLAQLLALLPGTSRAGITITAARFLGFERRDAARFSLLLSIPTIAGAGLLKGIQIGRTPPSACRGAISCSVSELKGEKWEKNKWATARTATMTAVSLHNDDMKMLCKEGIGDAEGRLKKIVDILAKVGVHLLPNGALEIYLPSYRGNPYKVQEDAKRPALQAEIEWMENRSSEVEMSSRYGDLYDVVLSLPSKQSVDFDPTLRKYLARYIHEVQQTIVANPKWLEDRVKNYLDSGQVGSAGFFSLRNLQRNEKEAFSATIKIGKLWDGWERTVQIDQRTNAGMGDFTIEKVDLSGIVSQKRA